VLAAVLLSATICAAEPEAVRYAILVGNDVGLPVRPALRYAASDARKMRNVLLRVGGFEEKDISLLEGGSASDLDAALDSAKRHFAAASGRPALLLFYFSGHSDGAALELGGDRVLFAELRRRVDDSGATLRLAFIDACLSGQMIGVRGATLEPAFEIDETGGLGAEGTVVVSSTSATEMAQESAELGGGVFTHHLVSGLYGAADQDGDLKVSLRELYRHAYGRTLGATARTLTGPQHPAYGFALEGKGDVVLSQVTGRAGRLRFPAGLPGSYFVLSGTDVLAQVEQGGERDRSLCLPAGDYVLVRRLGDGLAQARVALSDGDSRALQEDDFSPTTLTLAERRGGEERRPNGVVGYYALSGWFMPEMGAFHGGGLLVRRQISVLDLQLRAGYGYGSVNDRGFSYDLGVLDLAALVLLRIPIYRLDLLAGPVLGLSRFDQRSAVSGRWVAWSGVPGLQVAADIHLWKDLSLYLSWELDVMVFERDAALGAQPAPRAALGVGYAF